MPCNTPYRGDSAQLLLFKIASCCFDGGGSGVTSFNGRAGAVTLLASDVTPVADDIYVNETGDSMSGLLDITTAATSLQAITSDAGAANTPETIQIFHQTSAVPAVGFGNRLQFYADTDGGSDQIQARIDAQWVDAVDATRSSRLVFGTRNTGGVISSPLILTNGQLQLLDGLATIPSLSFQNDTDTGIFRAAVDALGFSTGGVSRWRISSIGSILAEADNSYNIGAPGATRPASIFVASGIHTPTLNFTSGAGVARGSLSQVSDGVFVWQDAAGTSFSRLQLGGTTSAFPAIKRNGAGLDFRLADDSGYAVITSAGHIMSVGAPLSITSGANQRAGNAVLVGGTVTVANTSVTANTIILLTRKISGGTIGFAVTYTVIATTSFTINSDNALDTSTYSYLLIEVP